MRSLIVGSLLAACVVQADIIEFDLSPPGTDIGVGLSPLNAVPPALSGGSGDELAPGAIWFDTDTSELMLFVGYGEATGFKNLTAPATLWHIHGPATTGQTAGVVVDFAAEGIVFPALQSTNGGIIYGLVPIPSEQVTNLLAGLHYVNIHTTNNPAGEIRGQLIPVEAPPPVET